MPTSSPDPGHLAEEVGHARESLRSWLRRTLGVRILGIELESEIRFTWTPTPKISCDRSTALRAVRRARIDFERLKHNKKKRECREQRATLL